MAAKSILLLGVVFVLLKGVVLNSSPKYNTKIWDNEGGSESLDVTSKDYVRTKQESASAASVGQAVKRVVGVEKYPVKQYYPYPLPVAPYGVGHGYGQGFGHGYGQGLGYGYGYPAHGNVYGSYGYPAHGHGQGHVFY